LATRSTLTGSALAALSNATLSNAALSGSALLELRTTRNLLAKLLRLAWLTLAALTLATLTLTALANTALPRSGATLLSLLELGATLARRPTELLRLALLPTLLAALTTLLPTTLLAALLPSRTRSRTAWSLIGRLAALLRLLSAGLAFVLLLALVFVLRVLALCDDHAAVCSAGALKGDTQLRNRNRRHQGAGEQDIAKLLQLPDRSEWQVALPGES